MYMENQHVQNVRNTKCPLFGEKTRLIVMILQKSYYPNRTADLYRKSTKTKKKEAIYKGRNQRRIRPKVIARRSHSI